MFKVYISSPLPPSLLSVFSCPLLHDKPPQTSVPKTPKMCYFFMILWVDHIAVLLHGVLMLGG